MAELRLKISDALESDMRKRSGISWSEVFERAARDELSERSKRTLVLSALNRLLKGSRLSEADALELGRKAGEAMSRRLKAQGVL